MKAVICMNWVCGERLMSAQHEQQLMKELEMHMTAIPVDNMTKYIWLDEEKIILNKGSYEGETRFFLNQKRQLKC